VLTDAFIINISIQPQSH